MQLTAHVSWECVNERVINLFREKFHCQANELNASDISHVPYITSQILAPRNSVFISDTSLKILLSSIRRTK
jgi:hypothetical protein